MIKVGLRNSMTSVLMGKKRLAALLIPLMAGGCVVGPDFHTPKSPQQSQYAPTPLPKVTSSSPSEGVQAQSFVTGLDIPGQWWTLFHSAPLNELIEEALRNNPDLQSAQAALRAAMEGVYAQQGYYYPTLQANATASRYHNASEVSPTLISFVPYFNLYSAQIGAGWTPDLWGGNRRQVESLKASADATRDQLEAAYLTLTSSLVSAAVQEASLRAQIAATRDLIAVNIRMLDILRQQLSTGYAAGLDVAAQEAQLAQTKAALPPLEKQLSQTRDLIAALAGKAPSDKISETFELSQLSLPTNLPVSVPAKLVDQRPDVRAAANNLHSASAQVGVAIANMLPNLTIDANDGTIATEIAQMFSPGNGYWMIGSSLTQTVFDGGTLLHKVSGARAAYQQAEAQYRSTVLSALQNVADTMHAVLSDADGLKASADAYIAAEKSFDLTRQQSQTGYTNYLALLSAEQADQQARINLIQAEAMRFADTAALYEAMGGGWWNRKDVILEKHTALEDALDLIKGP